MFVKIGLVQEAWPFCIHTTHQSKNGLKTKFLPAGFRPLYKVLQRDMNSRETLFAGLAGLRGSVSLILAQAVITEDEGGNETDRVCFKSHR